MELEGKVAFVTGGAAGIGLGIATALAQAGVKVMLADIDEAALAAAVAALRASNADVEAVRVDVSLRAELQAAADATIARFGKVHVVVNNAGVGGGGDYGVWTAKTWDWTIGVNLMSVVWGIEIFGPLIEAHGEGGQIVSTASISGLIAAVNPAYNVTKYGVVALSEGLRPVLAKRGIGVSVLCPGFIKTSIADSSAHLPARFGAIDESSEGSHSPSATFIRQHLQHGIDPLYVGELVREGVEHDWPYIFTDTVHEEGIAARFAGITAGFDRIRDRQPRY